MRSGGCRGAWPVAWSVQMARGHSNGVCAPAAELRWQQTAGAVATVGAAFADQLAIRWPVCLLQQGGGGTSSQ